MTWNQSYGAPISEDLDQCIRRRNGSIGEGGSPADGSAAPPCESQTGPGRTIMR
jgi:hypothetical protein